MVSDVYRGLNNCSTAGDVLLESSGEFVVHEFSTELVAFRGSIAPQKSWVGVGWAEVLYVHKHLVYFWVYEVEVRRRKK